MQGAKASKFVRISMRSIGNNFENLKITRFSDSADTAIIEKIRQKLPRLFLIAQLESSRAGKIGMEVGSLREKVVAALFIHIFGKDNVKTDSAITEPETDVIVNDKPISIKTITGNGGVKASWTVDAASARAFARNYSPKCDIILVQIVWNTTNGGFFLIPLEAQKEIFEELNEAYFKLPVAGTNPRGVEFSKEALQKMLSHPKTLRTEIDWAIEDMDYDVYKRWVEYYSK